MTISIASFLFSLQVWLIKTQSTVILQYSRWYLLFILINLLLFWSLCTHSTIFSLTTSRCDLWSTGPIDPMKKLKKHIQWVTRRGGPGGREGVVALGVIAGLISLEVGMVCAEHDLSYYFAPFRVNLNTSKSLSVKIKLHEDLLSILNCLRADAKVVYFTCWDYWLLSVIQTLDMSKSHISNFQLPRGLEG